MSEHEWNDIAQDLDKIFPEVAKDAEDMFKRDCARLKELRKVAVRSLKNVDQAAESDVFEDAEDELRHRYFPHAVLFLADFTERMIIAHQATAKMLTMIFGAYDGKEFSVSEAVEKFNREAEF